MGPPKRAAFFSFDEKTQVQALDRTQPSLPMRAGRAGTMTHDYERNGTVDLLAALNISTGEVITDCRQRHTSADVLAFFKQVDRSAPRGLSVHVVLDNLSAHMGPEVENWPLTRKKDKLVGTCTSCPPARVGSTSWSGGSRTWPSEGYAAACSRASVRSSTH